MEALFLKRARVAAWRGRRLSPHEGEAGSGSAGRCPRRLYEKAEREVVRSALLAPARQALVPTATESQIIGQPRHPPRQGAWVLRGGSAEGGTPTDPARSSPVSPTASRHRHPGLTIFVPRSEVSGQVLMYLLSLRKMEGKASETGQTAAQRPRGFTDPAAHRVRAAMPRRRMQGHASGANAGTLLRRPGHWAAGTVQRRGGVAQRPRRYSGACCGSIVAVKSASSQPTGGRLSGSRIVAQLRA